MEYILLNDAKNFSPRSKRFGSFKFLFKQCCSFSIFFCLGLINKISMQQINRDYILLIGAKILALIQNGSATLDFNMSETN
jgi:hypothetical protein